MVEGRSLDMLWVRDREVIWSFGGGGAAEVEGRDDDPDSKEGGMAGEACVTRTARGQACCSGCVVRGAAAAGRRPTRRARHGVLHAAQRRTEHSVLVWSEDRGGGLDCGWNWARLLGGRGRRRWISQGWDGKLLLLVGLFAQGKAKIGTLGKLKQKTDKSRVDQGGGLLGEPRLRRRVSGCVRGTTITATARGRDGEGGGGVRKRCRRLDIFRCEATPAPVMDSQQPGRLSASISSGTRRRGTRPMALCIASCHPISEPPVFLGGEYLGQGEWESSSRCRSHATGCGPSIRHQTDGRVCVCWHETWRARRKEEDAPEMG